jgi:hypothetical protein
LVLVALVVLLTVLVLMEQFLQLIFLHLLLRLAVVVEQAEHQLQQDRVVLEVEVLLEQVEQEILQTNRLLVVTAHLLLRIKDLMAALVKVVLHILLVAAAVLVQLVQMELQQEVLVVMVKRLRLQGLQ